MPMKQTDADILRELEAEYLEFLEAGGTPAQYAALLARVLAQSPAERETQIARLMETLGLDDDQPEPPSKAH